MENTTYQVTIRVDFYNPLHRTWEKKNFISEIDVETEGEAIPETKEFYAMEFGTSEDDIEIIKV